MARHWPIAVVLLVQLGLLAVVPAEGSFRSPRIRLAARLPATDSIASASFFARP